MRRKEIMIFKCLLISLFVIFLSFPIIGFSQPPNPKIWEPLGYQSYYNKKIITVAPDLLLVWTYKTVTNDVREKKVEEVKKYDVEKSVKYKAYHHECFLWEIDCRNKKMVTKEFIDFDKDGKVIDRYKFDNSEWESIVPASGADRLYQNACLPPKPPRAKKLSKKK